MRRSLVLLSLLPALAFGQPTFTHPDRIRFDGHCFTIDGKDTFIFSGAFHYFRCPKALWPERFEKIKEAGFNAIETYVPWNWSEQQKPNGLNDTSHIHLQDLDDFLTMAEDKYGLYTIVRPGPYICSEWATGGYPNWLAAYKPKGFKGEWFRGDNPVFESWSKRWFDAVSKVVDKHQLTHKPVGSHGVILWQVENEYDGAEQSDQSKRNYIKFLINASKGDGIDVPIFTCWTTAVRDPKGDPILCQAFDNPNEYPRWSLQDVKDGLDAQHEAQPWSPKMITEFQGGWFGQVGGEAAEEQHGIDARQENALTLYAIANGLTALNYYMLFGGTNFGDWAGQSITTSYDYNAPIREWGGVGDKYRVVKTIGHMLQQYGVDLARADQIPNPFDSDNPKVEVITRKGAEASYVFVRNTDLENSVSGTLGAAIPYGLGAAGMDVYRYTSDPKAGEWIATAKPPSTISGPMGVNPIMVSKAEATELTPTDWRNAPSDPSTLGLGIWDSRFIAYKVASPSPSGWVWMKASDGFQGGDSFDGGSLYPANSMNASWIYLNPGWPNGGRGMEEPHGLTAVQVFGEKPNSFLVEGWKTKTLTDPNDRTLVAGGMDTSGWSEPPKYNDFPEHTAIVYRATVTLPEGSTNGYSLSANGVDDEGYYYVNGQAVGSTETWNEPFKADVGKLLHPGANEIAIVVHNDGGPGGLIGAVRIEPPLPKGTAVDVHWTDQFSEGQYSEYSLDSHVGVLPVFAHPKIEGVPPETGKLVRSRIHLPSLPKAMIGLGRSRWMRAGTAFSP